MAHQPAHGWNLGAMLIQASASPGDVLLSSCSKPQLHSFATSAGNPMLVMLSANQTRFQRPSFSSLHADCSSGHCQTTFPAPTQPDMGATSSCSLEGQDRLQCCHMSHVEQASFTDTTLCILDGKQTWLLVCRIGSKELIHCQHAGTQVSCQSDLNV